MMLEEPNLQNVPEKNYTMLYEYQSNVEEYKRKARQSAQVTR